MPHSTRRRDRARARDARAKDVEKPWKKHDNIPL